VSEEAMEVQEEAVVHLMALVEIKNKAHGPKSTLSFSSERKLRCEM